MPESRRTLPLLVLGGLAVAVAVVAWMWRSSPEPVPAASAAPTTAAPTTAAPPARTRVPRPAAPSPTRKKVARSGQAGSGLAGSASPALVEVPDAAPETPAAAAEGGPVDRRTDAPPGSDQVLADIRAGMDLVSDDISSCIGDWSAVSPDLAGHVDVAFRIDADGLQEAWIVDHSEVPAGASTLVSAIRPKRQSMRFVGGGRMPPPACASAPPPPRA